MLTLQEIKSLPPDSSKVCPTAKVVVLDISEIEPATPRCKAKFFVIVADQTASISCTVYDISQRQKFIKNMAVVLVNILIKQSYIAVTERTEVGMCKSFDIPEEVRQNAAKLPGDQEMNIEMAKHSPVKTLTNIKGKVVNVYPSVTKDINDDTLQLQDIVIKDQSGSVTLALWDKHVNKFEKGQIIKVTKCRVKLFNGDKKLSTTRSTNCEVLGEDNDLSSLSEEEESKEDEEVDSNVENGMITSVFDVDPYLSCPNKGCNNSKLITVLENTKYLMQCKNCKVQTSASCANNYMRATIFFESGDLQKKVAIFLPQIQDLFKSKGIQMSVSYDRQEILSQSFEILPVAAKCKIINNTVRSISVKRDAEAFN